MIPTSDCRSFYSSPGDLTARMFCAGSDEGNGGGVDSCQVVPAMRFKYTTTEQSTSDNSTLARCGIVILHTVAMRFKYTTVLH